MRIVTFGDSLTAGPPADNTTASWPSFIARTANVPLANLAVAGYQTADQYPIVYGHAVDPADVNFYMTNTNDWIWYGTDPLKQSITRAALEATVYRLAQNVLSTKAGAGTEVGVWANTGYGGVWAGTGPGRYTTDDAGAYTGTFSGDVFTAGYVLWDAAPGQFTVAIDGVVKGTYDSHSPAAISTHFQSATTAPALIRIAGNGPGAHTYEIRKVPGTAILALDWIGAGSNNVPLYLMSAPKADQNGGNGYNHWPEAVHGGPGSDALVAVYRDITAAVAAMAVGDGLDVSFVDIYPLLDPAQDLIDDGLHENANGHWTIARAAIAAAKLG